MQLLIYLSIGTLAMLIPIMIQGNCYRIQWKKCVAAAILLTLFGTLGTKLMYGIENRQFGGQSFYGAVFFVPVFMLPVGKLLRIPYRSLMDLCASGECAMLAVMKIPCLITGCCDGREMLLFGKEVIFPSQIVELVTALILCVFLLYVSCRKGKREVIYPLYMITYGITRFFLNMGRAEWVERIIPLPFGNIWSLVSIVIGLIWLSAIRRENRKSANHS